MDIAHEQDAAERVAAEAVSRARRRRSGYLVALLFIGVAFFSGVKVGAMAIKDPLTGDVTLFSSSYAVKEDVDLSLLWKVWGLLDERFVSATTTEAATSEEKVWGAIQGLVRSYGDPYTVFMPPEDTQLFESDIAGEFSGVGMEVGMQNDVLTVIAPLPGTPAEKAGMLSGDVLVKINGETTEGMSVDEAVLKIRGEKGSEVKLTIFRDGEDEVREISIVRDIINVPVIKTEEKDGVFIIRLYSFSATSEAMMQDALRKFVQSGKSRLVLDLRGNPGGFLQSAVNIASYFLPTGKVIVRENFGEGKEEIVHRSLGRDIGARKPLELVVLVDGGSASASEILAGALQEHKAATIIGTHTFGKGSVQEVVDLPGGSSLKVTIARWLTPNGRSISNGGLAPDQEVEISKEDREAKRDPQLDAAIEFLKKN